MLDTRGVRLPTFDGQAEDWGDWSFAFKCGVRAMSEQGYKALMYAETHEVKPDETAMSEGDRKVSGELFDLLCQLCSGDALAVLRGIDDCKGVYAWAKLTEKYNPKTMASRVRLLTQVVGPAKVKENKDIESAIAAWKEKYKRLVSMFGERLSEVAEVACVTSMMPPWVQEYVYMHAQDSWDLPTLVERVRTLTANRMEGAAPMDVGAVKGYEAEHDCGTEAEDVQAIYTDMQCHRCHGWGHVARDCPSGGKASKGGKAVGRG